MKVRINAPWANPEHEFEVIGSGPKDYKVKLEDSYCIWLDKDVCTLVENKPCEGCELCGSLGWFMGCTGSIRRCSCLDDVSDGEAHRMLDRYIALINAMIRDYAKKVKA